MKVRLNGSTQELPDDATVADAVAVIAQRASSARGIAVAVNGEVVSRSRWNEVRLAAEDRVEVLRAVGGG